MIGKNIWIVGASTGIGRELSIQYSLKGKNVIASSRSIESNSDQGLSAESGPGRLSLDITDPEAVKKTVEGLFNSVDAPDTVFLCAAAYEPMSVDQFSMDVVEKLQSVNYLGTLRVISEILPYFRERGKGKIVVVASVAGYQGLPLSLAYGPTKAALINFCEALRLELDGSGVTVQVINPGFVRTPLTDKNKFKMPFIMEVEEAARRIRLGVEGQNFEICFPRRFVLILKFIRLLPYWLSLPILKKGTG